MVAHWTVPVAWHFWHVVHIILRKLLFVPVVLAAIWFDLRGALYVAGMVTALYLMHVYFQWAGAYGENINQIGEVATVWLTAILAGVLVGREKGVLRKLACTHEGALVALVSALDAREHNTQAHSLRVRAYAVRLGREIRMSEAELAILAQAALLHDVGKIGVRDDILLKPGPLNPEEWQSMREHPSIGRKIIEPCDFLREAARIVYTHHERFDGTGYPQGLGGAAIPLGARVFAVADALDALMSDRPYQAELSFAEAKSRILADSGTAFDPEVVRVFVAIPEEAWNQLRQECEPWSNLTPTPLPGTEPKPVSQS
ncbi:MAG: HD domain-containing protein [Candidatus Hydrogenedentes bacterium]|nr:HD domain-containing protein [Candidatus Hydrogenedentota bacterium]